MFILSCFYFFCFSAIAVIIVFLPKELSALGYSFIDISILLSMAPISRFIMPFISKKFLKINKFVFRASLFLFYISSVCFVFYVHNFYLALFFILSMGANFSIILPYVESVAIHTLGKEKYGSSRLFGSLGFIFVTLIVPYTEKYINTLYLMLISDFLIVFFCLFIKNFELSEKNDNNTFSLLKYSNIWIAIFFMQASFGGFYNFYTIYELEHGFDLKTITWLISFGVLCEVLIFTFQKQILSKKTLTFFISISIFLTIIRWLLIHFFADNIAIMYLSQSLHAFSFALFHSSIAIHLFIIYNKNPLSQQFLGGIGYGLGAFVGSITSGYLYGENLFLFQALFALFAFIFILRHNFFYSMNKSKYIKPTN